MNHNLQFNSIIVTITRAEANTDFDHIPNNVIGRNDMSNLKLALLDEGIQDLFDLSTISDAVIAVRGYIFKEHLHSMQYGG
jgi:hypothetical protein